MEPPGPIPNPEVKRYCADGSWAKGPARVGRCQLFARLLRKKEPGVFLPLVLERKGATVSKVVAFQEGKPVSVGCGGAQMVIDHSFPPSLPVMLNQVAIIRLGAVIMFLGVALGAFGAHGLEDLLKENDRVETWNTAVLYHLFHGIGLLVVGLFRVPPRGVWILFALGILIFSGSLYVLSLTNFTKLGMITPVGGLAFLGGWLMLFLRAGLLVKG